MSANIKEFIDSNKKSEKVLGTHSATDHPKNLDTNDFHEKFRSRRSMSNFGFRVFEGAPFPHAKELSLTERNNIIIHTINLDDGVGDFNHFMRYGIETNLAVNNKGFNIIGILEIAEFTDINKLNYILEKLKTNPFSKIFIIMNAKQHFACNIKNVVRIDTKNILTPTCPVKSALSLSCSYLSIKTGGLSMDEAFRKLLPEDVPAVSSEQYGYGDIRVHPGPLWHFGWNPWNDVSMGLTYSEDDGIDCFGIWLQETNNLSIEERNNRLLAFENKLFLKLILNTEEPPTTTQIESYFKTHKLMLAYLQNEIQGIRFIISHILKYTDEHGKLTHNCDFVLDGNSVNVAYLKDAIEGLKISNVKFVTKNSHIDKVNNGEPSVRIFYNLDFSNQDYDDLHRLTSDGAGCSGDTGCSDIISSLHLPFFSNSNRKSFVRKFAERAFVREFLLKITNKTGGLIFPVLSGNFETAMTKSWFAKIDGVSLEQPVLNSKIDKKDLIEKIVSEGRTLAGYLKNPQLYVEWDLMRKFLFQRYNYSNNYKNFILKGMLYLAGGIQYYRHILKQNPVIQDIILRGIMTDDQYNALSSSEILCLYAMLLDVDFRERIHSGTAFSDEQLSKIDSFFQKHPDKLKTQNSQLKTFHIKKPKEILVQLLHQAKARGLREKAIAELKSLKEETQKKSEATTLETKSREKAYINELEDFVQHENPLPHAEIDYVWVLSARHTFLRRPIDAANLKDPGDDINRVLTAIMVAQGVTAARTHKTIASLSRADYLFHGPTIIYNGSPLHNFDLGLESLGDGTIAGYPFEKFTILPLDPDKIHTGGQFLSVKKAKLPFQNNAAFALVTHAYHFPRVSRMIDHPSQMCIERGSCYAFLVDRTLEAPGALLDVRGEVLLRSTEYIKKGFLAKEPSRRIISKPLDYTFQSAAGDLAFKEQGHRAKSEFLFSYSQYQNTRQYVGNSDPVLRPIEIIRDYLGGQTVNVQNTGVRKINRRNSIT